MCSLLRFTLPGKALGFNWSRTKPLLHKEKHQEEKEAANLPDPEGMGILAAETMDGNIHYSHDTDDFSNGESATARQVSIEQLQHLVQLLDDSEVSEIEVTRAEEGLHLVLRKAKARSSSDADDYRMIAPSSKEAAAPVDVQHTVVASLVGIYHTWAKPRGKDLVAVGDRVKIGQLLGSIQSLNVVNEVESTVSGSILELLVQDGQAVEYGQPLMVIDCAEGA